MPKVEVDPETHGLTCDVAQSIYAEVIASELPALNAIDALCMAIAMFFADVGLSKIEDFEEANAGVSAQIAQRWAEAVGLPSAQSTTDKTQ